MVYFTLAELRALPEVSDTAKYTDARVLAIQADVEAVIERVCRTSFEYRSHTEVKDGTGGSGLRLTRRFPRMITAVTVDGVALTAPELLDLIVTGGVLERRASGSYSTLLVWPAGYSNVSVTYTAGYSSAPPADVKEAALKATRYRLLTTQGASGVSDRATSITNEFGNIQLSTAGENRPFGFPDVDEVVTGWARRLNVPGIA